MFTYYQTPTPLINSIYIVLLLLYYYYYTPYYYYYYYIVRTNNNNIDSISTNSTIRAVGPLVVQYNSTGTVRGFAPIYRLLKKLIDTPLEGEIQVTASKGYDAV